MSTSLEKLLFSIYEQIHEILRDSLKKRDQLIGFYLVLMAALVGSYKTWGELKNIHDTVVFGFWLVGLVCLSVIIQYWRWQTVLHLSMVTLQSVMALGKEPTIHECESIWNQVNETNRSIWDFLKPWRGVEINVIYLFSFITFIPFYVFLRNSEFFIVKMNSEVAVFILDAIAYVFILGLLSSSIVKRSLKFNQKDWMFRWLLALPATEKEIDLALKQEAMVNILVRKRLMNKKELLEEISRIKRNK